MLENSLHVCLLWSSTYLCHLFWCGSECSPPAVRFPPEQQQGTASPGTRVCAVPQSHSHTDVPTSSLGIGWCLWLCSRPVSQQTCSYLAPQVGIWHWSHRTAGSFPHRFCQPDRSWDKRLKTWMTLENTSKDGIMHTPFVNNWIQQFEMQITSSFLHDLKKKKSAVNSNNYI